MFKNRNLLMIVTLMAALTLGAVPVLAKTITDETGRRVEIPDNPQRIVALTPWVVELLFDLNHPPVGRPSSAVYPKEALKVPAHGTSYRLNYERILAMQPDLIIGNANLHTSQLPQLETIGAPVLLFNINSYEDVLEKTQILGEITGHTEEAAAIIENIKERFAKLQQKLPETGPTAVILVGSSEAFSVAKENSYIGDILATLGGRNIATGPEHRPGFTKLSLEYIAEADPDVIFAVKPARNPREASSALEGYDKNPLWSSLKAVKTGRVYELDPVIFFMNPGPRVIDALEQMAAYLYPEVF
ncbi:MAG: ABC transporter substrate-binding protein [Firmicutes bacterium]|nr:ABC transporter substrate-binding protein [Bacillota bacterium]